MKTITTTKPTTLTWNGWSIAIAEDGNTVAGEKPDPTGGRKRLTVTTTSGDATPWEIGFLSAVAAMADEDWRTATPETVPNLARRADYWNAYYKLYRQLLKQRRGEELVGDELMIRERYRESLRRCRADAGDPVPVGTEESL